MKYLAILSAIIMGCIFSSAFAAESGPDEVVKTIPGDNHFTHDFAVRQPGDVLIIHVQGPLVPGTSHVTGGSPVWVGFGDFTATGTIPGNSAGKHDGAFAGKYYPPPGGSGPLVLLDWDGSAETESEKVQLESKTLCSAPNNPMGDARTEVGFVKK